MLLEGGELLVDDLYLGAQEEGRVEDLGRLEGDARLDLVDADARGVHSGFRELDLKLALPEIVDKLAGADVEVQHVDRRQRSLDIGQGGLKFDCLSLLRPEVEVGGRRGDVGQVGALRLLFLGLARPRRSPRPGGSGAGSRPPWRSPRRGRGRARRSGGSRALGGREPGAPPRQGRQCTTMFFRSIVYLMEISRFGVNRCITGLGPPALPVALLEEQHRE